MLCKNKRRARLNFDNHPRRRCLLPDWGPKVQGQRQAVKVSDPFGPVRRNSRALRLRFVPAAATSRRMEDWRLVKPWLLLRFYTKSRPRGIPVLSDFSIFGSWKLSSIALSILRCLNFYQTVIQKAVTWITVHVDRGYRLKRLECGQTTQTVAELSRAEPGRILCSVLSEQLEFADLV